MTVVQGLVASSSRFGVWRSAFSGKRARGLATNGTYRTYRPYRTEWTREATGTAPPNAERQTLIHLYRRSFTVVGAALGGLFFSERCDSQIPDLLVELMKPRFREDRG